MAAASCLAGIAQLVERNLAKVEVAGSNPVSRSKKVYWLGGRVVMQRIANPSTPVRFRPEPPFIGEYEWQNPIIISKSVRKN